MTHLSHHNIATSQRLSSTGEMVRVLSTVVPVLLLCRWCQLGYTKTAAPVASSATVAVYASDTHLPRRRRQTTECEDVVEEKKATTIKGEADKVDVSSVNACKDYCITTVICNAVVYDRSTDKCVFAVSDDTTTLTGDSVSTTIYFKVAYRCPIHYRCSNTPCKNGATCKPAASGGVGVECVCAAGWKSWFCEERAPPEDTGLSNNEKTVIAAAVVGGVVVTGVAATVAVVSATGTTAAATTGTAAAGYDY